MTKTGSAKGDADVGTRSSIVTGSTKVGEGECILSTSQSPISGLENNSTKESVKKKRIRINITMKFGKRREHNIFLNDNMMRNM